MNLTKEQIEEMQSAIPNQRYWTHEEKDIGLEVCRMALAHRQACEQEAVGWQVLDCNGAIVGTRTSKTNADSFAELHKQATVRPLYAATVPAKSPWVKCSERLPTEKDCYSLEYVLVIPQVGFALRCWSLARTLHEYSSGFYPNMQWQTPPLPPEDEK